MVCLLSTIFRMVITTVIKLIDAFEPMARDSYYFPAPTRITSPPRLRLRSSHNYLEDQIFNARVKAGSRPASRSESLNIGTLIFGGMPTMSNGSSNLFTFAPPLCLCNHAPQDSKGVPTHFIHH